jgi:glucose/arabinose dehydrogenase
MLLPRTVSLLSLMIISIAGCNKSQVTENTNGQKMVPFSTGFSNPVCIANAGDSRLFVVEQSGKIQIVKSDGKINTQPFLDIHDKITFGGERGLLGIAFHPDYNSNGYFYVNYTTLDGNTNISRFKVNPSNPEIADPQSELKLLMVNQPFANHNGGDLCFGPDGYLYIGLGDGGSGGDPGNRAQNPMEYLGKMLRIDVNQGNPYAIPATNPFYNSTTTLKEIWALGLRNPWRFSFDRLTGDLWIADVGQNAIEEIDFQPAASTGGENYGWRCYEGNEIYNNSGCASSSSLTFPVYTYSHASGCSVTGGYVYRASDSSAYYGHYFFTDYCSDRIWTLHKSGGNWIKEDFGTYSGNNFSTFGEDSKGRLYIAGLSTGTIYLVIEQ